MDPEENKARICQHDDGQQFAKCLTPQIALFATLLALLADGRGLWRAQQTKKF
jgi:hypothetical protein